MKTEYKTFLKKDFAEKEPEDQLDRDDG